MEGQGTKRGSDRSRSPDWGKSAGSISHMAKEKEVWGEELGQHKLKVVAGVGGPHSSG